MRFHHAMLNWVRGAISVVVAPLVVAGGFAMHSPALVQQPQAARARWHCTRPQSALFSVPRQGDGAHHFGRAL